MLVNHPYPLVHPRAIACPCPIPEVPKEPKNPGIVPPWLQSVRPES